MTMINASAPRIVRALALASVLGCSREPHHGSATDGGSATGSTETEATSLGTASSTPAPTATSETGTSTSGPVPTSSTAPITSTSSISATDSTTTTEPDPETTSTSTGTDEVCREWIVHRGDLTVTDNTDLASLQCIVEVTGSLKILGTQNLASFAPLANLESVGNLVEINFNASLIDLDGLSGLIEVRGEGSPFAELRLNGNPSLVSIAGLHSLTSLDGLFIKDCDALTDLTGPQGPIIGRAQKGWGLGLVDNDSLENLDGLAALESFSHGIHLVDNPKLADLSALGPICDPSDEFNIYIDNNPALINLAGLELVTHASEIQIKNNSGLKSLDGLDGLEQVSLNLLILNNPALQQLTGLEQLNEVYIFSIEGNHALSSLAGLGGLTTITHGFGIGNCATTGNNALVDLHGLEQLTAVKGLGIDSNANLASLAGLDGLTSLEALWVQNNPKLASVEGTALAANFGANAVVCNNAGPPEACPCQIVQP